MRTKDWLCIGGARGSLPVVSRDNVVTSSSITKTSQPLREARLKKMQNNKMERVDEYTRSELFFCTFSSAPSLNHRPVVAISRNSAFVFSPRRTRGTEASRTNFLIAPGVVEKLLLREGECRICTRLHYISGQRREFLVDQARSRCSSSSGPPRYSQCLCARRGVCRFSE